MRSAARPRRTPRFAPRPTPPARSDGVAAFAAPASDRGRRERLGSGRSESGDGPDAAGALKPAPVAGLRAPLERTCLAPHSARAATDGAPTVPPRSPTQRRKCCRSRTPTCALQRGQTAARLLGRAAGGARCAGSPSRPPARAGAAAPRLSTSAAPTLGRRADADSPFFNNRRNPAERG